MINEKQFIIWHKFQNLASSIEAMGFSLMMKTLACLALLASLVVGQDIASTIATLQASQPGILVTGALSNVNSYQSKAKQSALNNLSNPTALQIGNYYALACIYYATNGVGNPRTEELIKSAPIPNWITENNWLTSNYCNWWGITCSAGNVIGIDLHENNLYGTWPPEVVLLKDQLQLIELFNNFFHHSTDPKWIAEMTELKFLYFGTTSWEYPGVPTYINGARKLSKSIVHSTSSVSRQINEILILTCLPSTQLKLTCPIPSGLGVLFVLRHLLISQLSSILIWGTISGIQRTRLGSQAPSPTYFPLRTYTSMIAFSHPIDRT
jgi:hypothetical protein